MPLETPALAPLAEAAPVLTEEETIESAKYFPRQLPKRFFEEERFLFPESYGINRVRLFAKDPQWLFVHWDVDPRSIETLRGAVGERSTVLSRLTLRVGQPGASPAKVILLPPGARSWYVKADVAPQSYQAELGVTLPSGEFRSLGRSNTAVTPRLGKSPEAATHVVSYKKPRAAPPVPTANRPAPADQAMAAPAAKPAAAVFVDALAPASAPAAPRPGAVEDDDTVLEARGGASDVNRPRRPEDRRPAKERGGASDVHRR